MRAQTIVNKESELTRPHEKTGPELATTSYLTREEKVSKQVTTSYNVLLQNLSQLFTYIAYHHKFEFPPKSFKGQTKFLY